MGGTMASRMVVVLGLTLALLALTVACAESENTEEKCTVTSDCSKVGFVCHRGKCVHSKSERACTTKTECLPSEECTAGYCALAEIIDADVVEEVVDVVEIEEDIAPEVEEVKDIRDEEILDNVPPQIIARSPEINAKDQPLNTVVTVTFNEAVIPSTIGNPKNFFLTDQSGKMIPPDIGWDPETLTATMSFNQPLNAWTNYQVTVTSNVLDLAQNSLVEVRWSFTTAGPLDQAFYDRLARAYAPVIYQDVADDKRDIPLKIDFDGDLRPVNNMANINSGTKAAHVYYNVSETESHFFIHYVFYYPIYKASSNAEGQTHTVNGALIVVKKVANDPLGVLQLMETYSNGANPGRIQSFIPRCEPDSPFPYCPFEFTLRNNVVSQYHSIDGDKYTLPEDPRRVRLYVREHRHELCHFAFNASGAGFCGHAAETFNQPTYAVLTLHEGAGNPTPPDVTTSHTGTYALRPLGEVWWAMATSRGNDPAHFYLDDFEYTPPSATQPATGNVRMPNRLNTQDISYNTGLFSPWAWSVVDEFALGKGQWFVDPAWAIKTRFGAPASFVFTANKYCYNLFGNIDRTQTVAACEHPQ